MQQYHELLKLIKAKGVLKPAARPGMPGTISLFGYQFRHKLSDGFPAMTTKKLYWKGVVVELIWFLKGDTNTKFLNDNGVTFWNADSVNYMNKRAAKQKVESGYGSSDEEKDRFTEDVKSGKIELNTDHPTIKNFKWGDCGYQYGKLWRKWENKVDRSFRNRDEWIDISDEIDQIGNLINGLKNSPEGRRHIITAWNPTSLDDMALNACHVMAQFNCRPLSHGERIRLVQIARGDRHITEYSTPIEIEFEKYNIPKYYLDCMMTQRSCDTPLGLPLNIASYALLTHILCKICNMIPGDYIHSFGDVHIYENQLEGIDELLNRTPHKLPELEIDTTTWSDDLLSDIESKEWVNHFIKNTKLKNYVCDPTINFILSTGTK